MSSARDILCFLKRSHYLLLVMLNFLLTKSVKSRSKYSSILLDRGSFRYCIVGNDLVDATARRAPLDCPVALLEMLLGFTWNQSYVFLLLPLGDLDWPSVARSPARLSFRRPSDARIFHDLPLPYYLSQLLSGHSRLNCFVHRINPLIPCGARTRQPNQATCS